MKLKLNLNPVRKDTQPLTASVNGTVLTINGTAYDLILLEDQAIAEHEVLGTVSRDGNSYECTVVLPHGYNAPEETRFPNAIVLENHNGPVTLPLYEIKEGE